MACRDRILTPEMEHIRFALTEKRDAMKISNREIAKQVGMYPCQLSRFFNGHQGLNLMTFVSICKVLDIQINLKHKGAHNVSKTNA